LHLFNELRALEVRATLNPVLVGTQSNPLCLPEILFSEYALISLHEPTNRRAWDLNPCLSKPGGHAGRAECSAVVQSSPLTYKGRPIGGAVSALHFAGIASLPETVELD